ncbi:hypothetical protein PInf_025297 [Phytophthora infestans]|nr:hypothetical protein PInf_025297 [Phytophthora infestans]
MFCVAEGERCVFQLDTGATDAYTDIVNEDPPASASSTRPEPLRSLITSTNSSSIPPTENDPRDVVLHSDGCAIALHLSVLQNRCPGLYKQLRQLRHHPESQNGVISLKVMEREEVRALQDQPEDASKCPLRDPQALRLDYVRCAIHKFHRGQSSGDTGGQISSSQDSPVIFQRRKRLRQDPDAVTDENQPHSGQVQKPRRARSLFSEVDVLSPLTLPSWGQQEQQRGAMHVRIEGTSIDAVVTSIEYIYRFKCVYIGRLKHHDVLVRAVMGLINSVVLVEFWRNLLDALSRWLSDGFQTPNPPSLRAMHRHFAPEWKPYMEIQPVELEVKAGEGNLFTLLQFGKFQLQVRIDITDEMPILWRIIRSASPQLLTNDPDDYAAFDNDPQFWIRGQMKVKYWRAQPNHAEVFQEIVIEYQHRREKYSQWCDLVPASPSSLAPVVSAAAFHPESTGKAQFRGRFFIWGDPVCSLYHFLLQATLFYSAPHGSSTELSDLMVVSEMQRLPLETLVLVLRSDRLRIPHGERTLLRCLNKLVFGKSFSYLGSSPNQVPHKYNGRAKDVIRLYKCVRWCFVPLDDIIDTLRRSPRELQFYELIEKGLQDTLRRFLRRRPWGWRKYRHAYMKNETNVVEFKIEAGENELSPEYFPTVVKPEPSSQDSLILSPDPVPPRSLSVPY